MDWDFGITYHGGHGGHYDSRPERVGSSNSQALSELRALNKRLDRFTLTCQSMWELLRDHSSLTEEDLEKKILEVDLRDGTADGKMSPTVQVCNSCGRNTNSTRSTCLYCGGPVQKASQFE